ncbi:porin [Paraburkholderia sp. CNPSo 3281]|uniref:porin n=1 Tax=Paraburkholderia sp. CNPSo 3281 TaxID=2940933 RepID=UPI0020B7490A|nr:porin [Paraburkholderia sp. CNPSo 3281]MCP3721005.1 porin [Paraburkholderia sp. CNPSo 3281]
MRFSSHLISVASIACLSSVAHAQSSVTLYGLADVSLVWANHANPEGQNSFQMSNGAINHSRWGLTGNEDLGGGLSAFFKLESGFNTQDGTLASPGVLFDRYAFVGLKSNYGTLSLGKQNTIFYNTFLPLDPLTVGDYYNTSWWYGTDQIRRPSSINYSADFGPVHLALAYGVGGVPGSIATGSQIGAAVTFTQGEFSASTVYQQTKNATGSGLQRIFGVAGSYAFGPATLYAGYQNNHDGAGIGNSQLNIAGAPLGNSNIARKDQGFFAGVSYQLTPAVLLREAYYYLNMHDTMNSPGNDGVRWTVVSEAEYSFSKRTSVYGQVDYNHTKGAANIQLPGANNQTEVAIGLRHWF